MWINKKDKQNLELQLERMTEERNDWRARYKCITESEIYHDGKNACYYISSEMLSKILDESNLIELKKKCEKLEQEVNKWQTLYADEVQKRLALIKQIKGEDV